MITDLAVLPDKVMLDTNVLLAATDADRSGHGDAVRILNEWPAVAVTLCVSGQVLREYLSVATRPAERNGLGLKTAEALGNVRAIRERTTLLTENAKVADRLFGLLDDIACGGRQVHDANIVATMLVHGIDSVVTANVGDFGRFGQFVSLIGL